MAKHVAEPHPPTVLESGMDYAEHEKTYSRFLTGVKWGIYGTAVLMVILFFVIQP